MSLPVHYQECNIALKPSFDQLTQAWSYCPKGREREYERLKSMTIRVNSLVDKQPDDWFKHVDLTAVLIQVIDFKKPLRIEGPSASAEKMLTVLRRMKQILTADPRLPRQLEDKRAALYWQELFEAPIQMRAEIKEAVIAADAAIAAIATATQVALSVRHPTVILTVFNHAIDMMELSEMHDAYVSPHFDHCIGNVAHAIFAPLGYRVPEDYALVNKGDWVFDLAPYSPSPGSKASSSSYDSSKPTESTGHYAHHDSAVDQEEDGHEDLFSKFPDPFSTTPQVNVNGMPMIPDTYIDVTGHAFGDDSGF